MITISDEPIVTDLSADGSAGTRAELLIRFPPRPVEVSWPETKVDRSELVARLLAPPFALENTLSQRRRRLGVLAVVSWLAARPGDTWQARWLASGAEDETDWRMLVDPPGDAKTPGRDQRSLSHLGPGLVTLICADVIRPSLVWLLTSPGARRNLAAEMARTRDTVGFDRLGHILQPGVVRPQTGQQALTRIAMLMAANGGLVSDVRVGDCVELLELTTTMGNGASMGNEVEAHARSSFFYQLLRAGGGLGEDAPAAIRVFSGRGQPSAEQLIDRYKIACRPVRDVLDYLHERELSVDFSSLQGLAYLLGKLFWADLEAHHPGIDSLKLSREVAVTSHNG